MIRVTLQRYHLKNNPKQKKAALVHLLQPATNQNIGEFKNKLGAILQEHYDCYILIIPESAVLNAFTFKLMAAFFNTIPGKAGLLLNEVTRNLVLQAKLESFFLIDETPGALITRIESRKKTGKS